MQWCNPKVVRKGEFAPRYLPDNPLVMHLYIVESLSQDRKLRLGQVRRVPAYA